MCAAACQFTGVGKVVFVAPDPSDDDSDQDPGGIEPEWTVVANLAIEAAAHGRRSRRA